MTFEHLPGENPVPSDDDPGIAVPVVTGSDDASPAVAVAGSDDASPAVAVAGSDDAAPALAVAGIDEAAPALTAIDEITLDGTAQPLPAGPHESAATGFWPGFRSARTLAAATVTLLAIDAAFMAVAAAFSVASAAATWKFEAGIDDESITAIRATVAALAGLAAVGQIAAAIPFLAWLHRSMTNARALDASSSRYSAGWGVGAWFVPLVNLVVPFLVMRNLHDGLAASNGSPAGRRLILVWWIAWLASICLVWVAVLANASGAYYAWAALAWTAYFVAAVLAMAVVRQVQRVADAREAHLVGREGDADGLAVRARSRRLVAVPSGFATAGALILLVFLGAAVIGKPAGPDWATFRSAAGGFTVALPRVPRDVSETSETAVGPAVQHTFASALDAMEKYSVAYVDFRAGAFAATDRDVLLDGFVGSVADGNERLISETAALGAVPGRQVRVRLPSGAIDEVRFYLDGDRVYILEADTTADRAISANIARFFSSFTLQP